MFTDKWRIKLMELILGYFGNKWFKSILCASFYINAENKRFITQGVLIPPWIERVLEFWSYELSGPMKCFGYSGLDIKNGLCFFITLISRFCSLYT